MVMSKVKAITLLIFLSLFAVSCQESLEDRAVRDAKDYTRKYCPTPVINCTRTDSVVFDKQKHLYTYYITFVDNMDNVELINEHKAEIIQMLQSSVRESTSMKTYLEAGFKFQYVCRSGSDKKKVLLECII